MKRNILAMSGILLTLAACGVQQTIVQQMVIRSTDSSVTMSLIQATERVMNRRLAAVDIKNAVVSAVPTGTDTAKLTVNVKDSTSAEKVKSILREPFTFDIRIEKPNVDPKAASDWIPTALTGSSIAWVNAVTSSNTGEVSIELQFTKEGKGLLQSVFDKNVGKHAGIFVRELLVSKLTITNANGSDFVLIGGVPSAKVAEIFADDVNVGLFVDFIPVP